jgi:hypothetical protein
MATNESLRDQAAALRAELAQAHELDAPTREALRALADEVETLLDTPVSQVAERPPDTLRERLTDRLRELEATHPRLSSTLGNLIDTLAFYGL